MANLTQSPTNRAKKTRPNTPNLEESFPTHAEALEAVVAEIGSVPFKEIVGGSNVRKKKKGKQDAGDTDADDGPKVSIKQARVIIINEFLDALRLRDLDIRFFSGRLNLFNGQYWAAIDDNQLKRHLSDAAINMKWSRWDAKDFEFIDKLHKQLVSASTRINNSGKASDILINMQGGTLAITNEKWAVRPYNADDQLTYCLPFQYDSEATAPRFMSHLERFLPEIESRMILQEYMGYVLHRELKLEKVLLLYGRGMNGKSVIHDVMRAMFGRENVTSYTLQSLTKSESYERGSIADKLLNWASEISGSLESTFFKALASGEAVQARHIFGAPFIMDNYARLIFNCNKLPVETELTKGFFRRFLIIPFNVEIPADEKIENFARTIIETELPGVLNWVLEGLQRISKQREFTESNAVTNALEAFETQSDSVAMFLQENDYVPRPGGRGYLLKDFYEEYRNYCGSNGFRPCGSSQFVQRLAPRGIHKVKSNGYNYIEVIRDPNPNAYHPPESSTSAGTATAAAAAVEDAPTAGSWPPATDDGLPF